jgi:hypothetical protein
VFCFDKPIQEIQLSVELEQIRVTISYDVGFESENFEHSF